MHVDEVLSVLVYRPPHVGFAFGSTIVAARAGAGGACMLGGCALHFVRSLIAAGEKKKVMLHLLRIHTLIY